VPEIQHSALNRLASGQMPGLLRFRFHIDTDNTIRPLFRVFRNQSHLLSQSTAGAEESSSYSDLIAEKVPGYSEEGLEKAEPSFGVIVLETTRSGAPEEIYSLCKRRRCIVTYSDCLRHQMGFNAPGAQDWAKLQGHL